MLSPLATFDNFSKAVGNCQDCFFVIRLNRRYHTLLNIWYISKVTAFIDMHTFMSYDDQESSVAFVWCCNVLCLLTSNPNPTHHRHLISVSETYAEILNIFIIYFLSIPMYQHCMYLFFLIHSKTGCLLVAASTCHTD